MISADLFEIDLKAEESVEAADDFAAEFDVADLIFADRDEERRADLAVDHDVGGLNTG